MVANVAWLHNPPKADRDSLLLMSTFVISAIFLATNLLTSLICEYDESKIVVDSLAIFCPTIEPNAQQWSSRTVSGCKRSKIKTSRFAKASFVSRPEISPNEYTLLFTIFSSVLVLKERLAVDLFNPISSHA